MEVRMNSKQRCARYAQSLIKEGMIVGLGGGQTIQYLIEEIKENFFCIEKKIHFEHRKKTMPTFHNVGTAKNI